MGKYHSKRLVLRGSERHRDGRSEEEKCVDHKHEERL
jgi:hypothetical protein